MTVELLAEIEQLLGMHRALNIKITVESPAPQPDLSKEGLDVRDYKVAVENGTVDPKEWTRKAGTGVYFPISRLTNHYLTISYDLVV